MSNSLIKGGEGVFEIIFGVTMEKFTNMFIVYKIKFVDKYFPPFLIHPDSQTLI